MRLRWLYTITRWSVPWITSFCFLHAAENRACDSLWIITSHKAEIEIFPSTGSLSCTDTITFMRSDDGDDIMCMKLLPLLTIRSMTHDGKMIDYARERERITIHHVPSDEEFDIVVRAEGTFSAGTEFSRITESGAVIRLDEILPSAQHKYKSVRLIVSVPSNWESVGPGELSGDMNDDVRHKSIWECNQPLPLLGWICAGDFKKSESADRGILFSAYMNPEDSINASAVLRLSQNVVRFYSEKFTQYRFSRLSIVEVDNWVAGNTVLAIASPAFIMVKRFAFTTDDLFNRVESILAHEIAHQWWPLTVFVGENDIPFLSEGLCEHSARWFNSSIGQESGRDSLGNHPLLRPLLLRILRNEETPLMQKTDMRSSQTHYLKGAYVHHMLRNLIGEAQSEKLYMLYASRYAERESNIGDFIAIAESLAGKSLAWFFDQWLTRTDIPQLKLYNVKTMRRDRGWTTEGRVRIVGYQKFTADVTVQATDSIGGAWDTVTVGLDSAGRYRNDVPFRISTERKPSTVLLDPSYDVLKHRKLPPKLSDLREASDGIMIVGTLKHNKELRRYAVRDSSEMAMSGWNLVIIADTSATLIDLQKGRIFLYGKPDENRISSELQEKFPYRFAGDSVIINNETVMDSSLSCIQVIDNPFIQHGLLVWIAHLGMNVTAKLLPYDASWIILKGKDEIEKGVWEVRDEDLRIDIL
jgi:hypothetical protein